jgi:hypothetical protein
MGNGSGFKFGQKAEAHVIKGVHNKIMNPTGNGFGIGGIFHVTCIDKDGNIKWETTAKNGVTNVGLDSTLDVYFNATNTVGGVGAAGWGWALGLINNSPAPTLAAADTHASHAGWVEFTSYTFSADATIRPQWSPGAAASQSLVNGSLIDYDVTGAATVHGLFITGGNISGGTPAATDADNKGSSNATPLLWATAAFTGGNQAVTGGDILRVTYTVNAQSA